MPYDRNSNAMDPHKSQINLQRESSQQEYLLAETGNSVKKRANSSQSGNMFDLIQLRSQGSHDSRLPPIHKPKVIQPIGDYNTIIPHQQ